MKAWSEVEPLLRERAYRTLDNDPQILFDRDGGPDSLDVDLIYARLIGFEAEIVEDGMRLDKILSDILMPIPRRPILLSANAAGVEYEIEPMRTARYTLQSGHVTLSVSGEFSPPVESLRPDGTARIGYLRYKRTA